MSASVAAACECGKKLWPTKAEADEALVGAKIAAGLRHSTRRRERRAYPCPAGSGWHLTSLPESAAPTPHHDPDDDQAAAVFIDKYLVVPFQDIVWQALVDVRYVAQTERVLAKMLHNLQSEMARRRAGADASRGATRAAYRRWSVPAMARQAALAERRREVTMVLRQVNRANSEESAHQLVTLHRKVLRRLAVAVGQHRAQVETPTAADRQLWAWLGVLSVPDGGESTSLDVLLADGRWS